MREAPYRKQATVPAEKPRGIVVTRADEPQHLEAEEQRRIDARRKAQTILAQAELEDAQARADRTTRLAGGALIAISIVLGALSVSSLGEGYYHPRTVTLIPAAFLVGVWAISVGAGGASSIDRAPMWVKIGGVVAAGIGMIWGATGFLDFLLLFVG